VVTLTNDPLGTHIACGYIKCLFDGYIHNTIADHSKFEEVIAWNADTDF